MVQVATGTIVTLIMVCSVIVFLLPDFHRMDLKDYVHTGLVYLHTMQTKEKSKVIVNTREQGIVVLYCNMC